MKLMKSHYTRASVKKDTKNIYVFTDNQDRNSGKNAIPDDSEYSKRFNKTDLHYPTMTSAKIRGLDNAFPITTQKHYVAGISSWKGNWNDEDFEDFKKVIDADFEIIKEACVKLKPVAVIFPENGVLNSNISKLTFERTPLLYNYIIKKEIELRDFKID